MIPHIFFQIFFACLSKMIAFHQNVVNCQNTLTVFTLKWRISLQDECMGQRSFRTKRSEHVYSTSNIKMTTNTGSKM